MLLYSPSTNFVSSDGVSLKLLFERKRLRRSPSGQKFGSVGIGGDDAVQDSSPRDRRRRGWPADVR
jgi:hypothetical protein